MPHLVVVRFEFLFLNGDLAQSVVGYRYLGGELMFQINGFRVKIKNAVAGAVLEQLATEPGKLPPVHCDSNASDTISRESLLNVLLNLYLRGESIPATRISDCHAIRTVRRVLAWMRHRGMLVEEGYRENGSPRVRRAIQWGVLVKWLKEPQAAFE